MQIVSYRVGAWGLYPCYKTYSLWIKWIWVTWFCPVFDLYRWWCSGSADWYATQVRRGTCHLLFFPRTFPYFWPPSPSVTWITLHVELVFASRSSQISHMPVSREIFPFFSSRHARSCMRPFFWVHQWTFLVSEQWNHGIMTRVEGFTHSLVWNEGSSVNLMGV